MGWGGTAATSLEWARARINHPSLPSSPAHFFPPPLPNPTNPVQLFFKPGNKPFTLPPLSQARPHYEQAIRIFETDKPYRITKLLVGDASAKRIDFVRERLRDVECGRKPDLSCYLDSAGTRREVTDAMAEEPLRPAAAAAQGFADAYGGGSASGAIGPFSSFSGVGRRQAGHAHRMSGFPAGAGSLGGRR